MKCPIKKTEGIWLNKKYGNIFYCKSKSLIFPIRLILKIFIQLILKLFILMDYFRPSLLAALFAIFLNKKVIWSVHGVLSNRALWKKIFSKKNIFISY